MARYKGDPRWITVRYAGQCAKCEVRIARGERAYYHPTTRTMACRACGEKQAAEFQAAAWDEDHNGPL